MIWEWIPAHSPIEDIRIVRILASRAEVEDPKVLSVSMFEELLRVFSAITIKPLQPNRRVAHNNHLISDVHQVCVFGRQEESQYFRDDKGISWVGRQTKFQFEVFIPEPCFITRDEAAYEVCHICRNYSVSMSWGIASL